MKVALCDDHQFMMDGQRSALVAMGHEVVAMASRGRELLQRVRTGLDLDMAIVDLSMPGINGVDTIARLLMLRPKVKCLVMTMHDDPGSVCQAMTVGASGYVWKSATSAVFTDAVRTVLSGGTYLSPELGSALVNSGGRVYRAQRVLSLREREVLTLIARGKSDKAVGAELGITARTARFHRDVIRRDCHCPTTAELTLLAVRMGLITVDCGLPIWCGERESIRRDAPNNSLFLDVVD